MYITRVGTHPPPPRLVFSALYICALTMTVVMQSKLVGSYNCCMHVLNRVTVGEQEYTIIKLYLPPI